MGFIKQNLYDWCLENNRLDLLESWDPHKNGERTPRTVGYASNSYAWWVCSECGYSWKAKICNRSVSKRGCPLCANKVVVAGRNDLATTHPELASEWHPTKNGHLTPQDVSYGYGKPVWWRCSEGHSYKATVNQRTASKTGCPICYSGRQTSFAEQAFFFYFKKFYPDAVSRYKAQFLGRMELDIYIPSIKTAIEYDGIAWHKSNHLEREQLKYSRCRSQGIRLIRVREESVPLGSDVADYIFQRDNLYEHNVLEPTIKEVLRRVSFWGQTLIKQNFDVDIERDRFQIMDFCSILKKGSLLEMFPEIATEWHPTKNGDLLPSMVKTGSDLKVWWKCSLCSNDYESSIGHRTRGTGCPKCALERVTAIKRKPVLMIHSESNQILREFKSIAEAARELKINGSNITSVCKGNRPLAGGYIWRYKA